MVGATLAGLLLTEPSLQALRIAVIEARLPQQAPNNDIDIRVSALSRAAQRMLERIGAWTLLPVAQRSAYQNMVVWDAASHADADDALRFRASALGEPNLGHIIANNWVQWSALQAIQHERITRFAASVQQIALGDEAARLQLDDGRRFSAALVIGADGANSNSRQCVGITTRSKPYAQTALVTHIHTEQPHRATAWQRFLPSGPLALLPLNDGRSSIVWSTSHEQAQQLLERDDQALSQLIGLASDHVLGEVQVAAPRGAFPLQLAQVDEYCRPRFVLVGDAAHSVHPLAGQGVNLGLLDAACLVQVLSDAAQAGAGINELAELRVLRRYERWRKSENSKALSAMDGLNRLFSNDQGALRTLRRTGMRVIEQLPLAKQTLMLRALGVAGELPDLLRRASL